MPTPPRPGKHQRMTLSVDLKAERSALFVDGAWPSKDVYDALFHKIHNTHKTYTRKVHSNYQSRKRWARHHNAVDDLTAPPTRHGDFEGDFEGGPWPHTNGSIRVVHPAPPPDPLFTTRTVDDVLRLCDPGVRAQVIEARNPTADQFLRWERVAGVPAVELFWAWQAVRRGAPASTALQVQTFETMENVPRGLVAAESGSSSHRDVEPPSLACGSWEGTSTSLMTSFQPEDSEFVGLYDDPLAFQ